MDRYSILMINEFTDAGIKTEPAETEGNVCKAIEDMKNEAGEEGFRRGCEQERANTERERTRADEYQAENK